MVSQLRKWCAPSWLRSSTVPWVLFYSILLWRFWQTLVVSYLSSSFLSSPFILGLWNGTLFKRPWHEKEWPWPGHSPLTPGKVARWSNTQVRDCLVPVQPGCGFQSNQLHLGDYMTMDILILQNLGQSQQSHPWCLAQKEATLRVSHLGGRNSFIYLSFQ